MLVSPLFLAFYIRPGAQRRKYCVDKHLGLRILLVSACMCWGRCYNRGMEKRKLPPIDVLLVGLAAHVLFTPTEFERDVVQAINDLDNAPRTEKQLRRERIAAIAIVCTLPAIALFFALAG